MTFFARYQRDTPTTLVQATIIITDENKVIVTGHINRTVECESLYEATTAMKNIVRELNNK